MTTTSRRALERRAERIAAEQAEARRAANREAVRRHREAHPRQPVDPLTPEAAPFWDAIAEQPRRDALAAEEHCTP